MRKPERPFLMCGILLFSLILIVYPYRRRIKGKIKHLLAYVVASGPSATASGSCPSCPQLFYDNVLTHKLAYLNDGISPQENDRDLENLSKSGTLQKIKTNNLFIVRNARFSVPYILPKGLDFINELANLYYSKCKSDSLNYIPFTISSVTRSKESVEKLIENNGNAIKNSSHLRGKTFDINYSAFNKNKKQTKALTAVLNDLKKQNRCFVKFERNGCLHITVI